VPVPQVAFLYSTTSHYREINSLFGRDLSRLSGTLQALLESQLKVDVVSEHILARRMSEYPLNVVGECDYLEPAFKQQLVHYVENGGHLLLIGPQAASLFGSELDVALEATRQAPFYLACGDAWEPTRDQTQKPKLGRRAKAFGELHATNDSSSAAQPAATVAALGKGKIAATYFSFSRGYLDRRSPKMRAFLSGLARELFPRPMVQVQGSSNVDVSVNRLHGKLAISLVNTSGPHWDMKNPLFDAIESVGPLELTIRAARKPGGIVLQPEGKPLPFKYQGGLVRLTVPRLDIHSIVLVE
jgi:hypothetical protein